MKYILIFVLTLVAWSNSHAQRGWQLRVKIANYSDSLHLGVQRGVKPTMFDSTKVGADGFFTFKGDSALARGVYTIQYRDSNTLKQFYFIMTPDKPNVTIDTKLPNPYRYARVGGTTENIALFRYLGYIQEYNPDMLTAEFYNYQNKVVNETPQSPLANTIIKMCMIPQPDASVSDKQAWAKAHYIDNLDFASEHFLRFPLLFNRMEEFTFKYSQQKPELMQVAVDTILQKSRPYFENFHYLLPYFLNTFSRTTAVGMDAMYVHLANNYYAKGYATWMDADRLARVMETSKNLQNVLIGSTIPNVSLFKEDNSKIKLHDIQSPYTLLFVWDPDCGHCKKTIPDIQKFETKYKDQVKIVALCNKTDDGVGKCWEYIKKNNLTSWIHLVDPKQISRYRTIFDVRFTPQVYLLDENKKIIYKRLGEAGNLEEIMDELKK